jgi:transposase
MDSNKCSTQVERLAVVETGRRRRWTDDEKLRIVLESLQTPRAVASTARRHGVSRSLLLIWRRSFEASAVDPERPKPAFVPAMVVDESAAAAPPATAPSSQMVIELGERGRVIVDAGVDAEALARVLAVLGRR